MSRYEAVFLKKGEIMLFHRKLFIVTIVVCSAFLAASALYAGSVSTSVTRHAAIFVSMPAPGEKVPIGNDMYMIYGFVEKPKMGPVIMKIQVFDKNDEKDRSVIITADSGMPSMPSMGTDHATCMLNKKGDYLVPINITMPGDWEVKITITKHGKVMYRGSYRFDV
jgi:hypothetical protein